MKATTKPEISRSWWTSEKPDGIKGVELEKALARAEKALSDEQKKKGDLVSVEACLAALEDLSRAVDRTVKKECDKKEHKDVISVLSKYTTLIQSETSRLEGLKKSASKSPTTRGAVDDDDEEEDEEDEGKIFDKDYLYKMCKLLKSTGKELKFGFGVNPKSPESSQLVLRRKGKPERLFKALKKTGTYPSRLITYGLAVPDPQDGKTLVLRLAESAGEPPQIVKLGRRFLRADKNLRFRKLKLILPGGQTIEDNEPDTDDDVSSPVLTAQPQPSADTAAARETAVAMENMRNEFKQARKRWVTARAKAEQDLEVVKDGVRNYYLDDLEQFPIAMQKLKELDDIMDNLSDALRDALDAYVSTPLKQQDRLRELVATARQVLESFAQYIANSPLMAAIDQREFADVQIKSPLMTAMRDLARTIK